YGIKHTRSRKTVRTCRPDGPERRSTSEPRACGAVAQQRVCAKVPLLSQEGWLRDVLPAQPGWFQRIHIQVSRAEPPRRRLLNDASRYFIDGAATPPNSGGEFFACRTFGNRPTAWVRKGS